MKTLSQNFLIVMFATWASVAQADEQPITLEGGDYLVPGILALPSQDQHSHSQRDRKTPSVLLLHGTASQKNEVGDLFKHLAQQLAKEGMASLRIDFAGTGDSPVDYRRYTLSSAHRDANSALEYLRAHPKLGGRVAVLGFSQGGLIAQRLVVENPDVDTLVTWSTAATNGAGSFKRFFEQYYETAKRDGYASVNFPWLDEPLNFDLRWFTEIEDQQTLAEVAAYPGPVFAIAGDADNVVPYQQSSQLVAQSSNPLSEFVLVEDADHIFNVLDSDPPSKNPSLLLKHTVSWLKVTLGD